MKTQRKASETLAAWAMALLLAADAQAQVTTTWTGGISTDWNLADNWNNGVPGDGINVIVPNTTTKPTMAAGRYPVAGRFGSFEVQVGAIVTCLGDPTAENTDSGGDGSNPHGIGVSIFAVSATMAGTLDANQRGFASQQGPGKALSSATGAAHGGRALSGAAALYGQLATPTALGSGGWHASGTGGGAIRVDVTGTLTLTGTIRANATGNVRGNGSGGSVWLAADTFEGSGGSIQAIGGNSDQYSFRGAGSGGRITILCTTWSYTGSIAAAGGTDVYDATYTPVPPLPAQSGTLWAPSMPFVGDVVISSGCRYHFPDEMPRTLNSLTITNNAYVELHGGDLTVTNLVIANGAFRYDRFFAGQPGVSGMTNFTIVNDITIHQPSVVNYPRGHLFLLPVIYEVRDLSLAAGTTVTAYGDRTAANTFSGGSAGSPHGQGLIVRCRNATLGGTITANGLGFPENSGPAGNVNGAGHGGRGQATATTYGRMTAPTALGSGGLTQANRAGGGSVTILATGDIAMTGTITANAQNPNSGANGVGAGGSIWLAAAGELVGGGTLGAIGGACPYNTGHGGGGRIVIEAGTDGFNGTINVQRGFHASYPTDTPQTGTVFRASGAAVNLELDGVDGVRLATTLASSANDRLLTRSVSQWTRIMEWTDTAKRFSDDTNDTNSADYKLSGLAPDQKLTVYVNDLQDMGLMAADGTGELLIAGVALDPKATVRVEIPPEGTLLLFR